jgi:hypothetical protein
MSVAYDGTLPQWQQFLQDKPLLPASLMNVQLDVDYGSRFRYASDRISLSFTPKVQSIAQSSRLTLGFAFFKNKNGYTLDVADVRVKPQNGVADRINVRRVLKPAEDMGDQSKLQWQKYAEARHPFDGVPYMENDVAEIGAVLTTAHPQPDVLYSAFLGIEGNQPPALMKSKLDMVMSGVQISE